MTRRSAVVEQTRRRIVDATVALHAEQGVLTTSFEDVAKRADVAVATVYRHFPTLEDIVGACGERIVELIQPPSADRAAELFACARSTPERVRCLVSELCAFYERGAPQLATAHREAAHVPAIADSVEHQAATRRALVEEALRPKQATERIVSLVSGITAFPVWRALRDAGLDEEATRDAIASLVDCAVAQTGKSKRARGRKS